MKSIVISGSASLQERSNYWREYWTNQGYKVLDYPKPIGDDVFLEKYPNIFRSFFKHLQKTDSLFIMNEDKDGTPGYIGAAAFSELCFCVVQNQINDRHIEIVLLKEPHPSVQSYDEVALWLELGWIKILKDK